MCDYRSHACCTPAEPEWVMHSWPARLGATLGGGSCIVLLDGGGHSSMRSSTRQTGEVEERRVSA